MIGIKVKIKKDCFTKCCISLLVFTCSPRNRRGAFFSQLSLGSIGSVG